MIIYKLFAPLPSLHPLFYITLAYMLGICWAAQVSSFSLTCFLGVGLLCLSRLCTNSIPNFYMLMVSTMLSFFAGQYIFHTQKQQFYTLIHSFQKPVDIIATITNITPCSTKNYRFIVTAYVEKTYIIDCSENISKHITPYHLIIYTKQQPRLLVQDRIFLSSVKITPPKYEAWHTYALKHNIGGTLFCNKLHYDLITHPNWSCKRWLWSTRQSLWERLLKKMSSTTAPFYSLLFMGMHYQNKETSDAMRTPFQIWGILHYLARSGLHLVVFIMIWNFLLLAIPCSYAIREGLLFIVSCIYFLLSWPSLSFVRAFATYILYKTLGLCMRTSNTLHVLTLVTLFFLIANPIYLFCLDFQLSFGLTFALAWLQNNNFMWKNSYTNS